MCARDAYVLAKLLRLYNFLFISRYRGYYSNYRLLPMQAERPLRSIYLRLGYVVAFTSLIYLTIPFARDIERFLRDLKILRTVVYCAVFIFISAVAFIVIRYIGYRLFNIIILTLFIAIYLLIIKQYSIMVEKIHFIEYGLLAFLVYHSLREAIPGLAIYPVSLIIVTAIGWGDELIQYFLPGRVYDKRDVFLNALSGALILILLYIVDRIKDYRFR
jgi:hypothetical protein